MPRYGFRRPMKRRGKKWDVTNVIQHTPSTMDNTILTLDQLVVICAVPNVDAGGAMTTDRTNEDRLTQVANGRHVGRTTLDVDWLPGATNAGGIIEYMIWRIDHAFAVPVVGGSGLPTDAEVGAQGMQQAYRQHIPGWCLKYGQLVFTLETQKAKKLTINWAKFKKDTMKDGTYFGVTFFNRSDTSVTMNVQMRYKTYG